jgi:hypothetical protein
MNVLSLFDQIATELQANSQLDGSQYAQDADGYAWTRNTAGAKITPSGSTGIVVALLSSDRVVHQRIFAASPMSVARIVRTITEHLTGYVS